MSPQARRAAAREPEARGVCTPCRGTGKVASSLGGEPHEVSCPWCGGSGNFVPGRDAQEAGPADDAAARPAGPADAQGP